MSAFVGLLSDHIAAQPKLLNRLAEVLYAPGLEPPQHWSAPGLSLVHRLRITAPEDRSDQQPRIRNGVPLVLVFDGYLINRPELIDALNLPREASSWPDSEITFEAIARWGEQAPERLLGDFALAAWNTNDCTLLLARDGIGQRPLYYHQSAGLFAFATSPTALLSIPGIPRELDDDRFIAQLTELPVDPHSTLYKHLRSLPAGSVAMLRSGRLTLRRYWTPARRHELRLAREEDYIDAARELFERAVRDCLRIEGPAFSSLTGGLDSSAVSVTAAKYLPGNTLTTLTCLPAEGTVLSDSARFYASERPFVEHICEQNPELKPLFFRGPILHRWDTEWTQMFRSTGVPWRNTMNLAWMGPSRDYVQEQGGRVLLSGGLGNVTLSWNGAGTLPGLMRSGNWIQALQEARALAQASGLPSSIPRQVWRTTLAPFLPDTLRQWAARLQGKSAWAEWTRYSPIKPARLDHPQFKASMLDSRHTLNKASWQLRQSWFEANQQPGLEAMGLVRALHGFEVRDPMADRRLLEFCFSLPDSLYLKGGVSRLLARRTIADRLPAEVVSNHKRGKQCPEYLQRMGSLRPFLDACLNELDSSPLAQQLLDLKRMKAMLDNWPKQESNPEYLATLHRGLHFGQFLRWVEIGDPR